MSKKEYDINYHKTKLKRIAFDLNVEKDKDIILYLESHKPFQTELKRLIREQIKKSG